MFGRVVVMLVVLLGLTALSIEAQQPASPPVSCETRLQVWQQNATSFMSQVLDLEAVTRELRQQLADATKQLATVTHERDEAVARAKDVPAIEPSRGK